MTFIISQIIGVAAVALYFSSFQWKRRSTMVLAVFISNVFYVSQYVLLGAFSGAVLDVLSTVSSFFAGKKNSPRLSFCAKVLYFASLFCIFAFGSILALMQRDWVQLLPVIGALLQTGGLWFDNEQTIRKFGLAGAPFWLGYNFISQAYGASLGSALMIVSGITALLRYQKKK